MPANQFVWYQLGDKRHRRCPLLLWEGNRLGGTRFSRRNERYVILNTKSKGVGGVMASPMASPSRSGWAMSAPPTSIARSPMT